VIKSRSYLLGLIRIQKIRHMHFLLGMSGAELDFELKDPPPSSFLDINKKEDIILWVGSLCLNVKYNNFCPFTSLSPNVWPQKDELSVQRQVFPHQLSVGFRSNQVKVSLRRLHLNRSWVQSF
jgi:hypothetical protein